MKKTISVILLGFCLLISCCQAQLSDKWMFEFGVTDNFIPTTFQLSPNTPVFSSPPTFFGATLSGNYLLAHSADMFSLSADGSFNFALAFSPTFNYLVSVPAFVMGKIGARATPFNQQIVGVGVGVGLNAGYFTKPFFLGNSSNIIYNYDGYFASPALCGQLTVNFTRGQIMTFRVIYNLFTNSGTIPVNSFKSDDVPVNIGYISASILYGF